MARDADRKQAEREALRAARLAAALRENLKRRKAQLRERAADPVPPGERDPS